MHRFLPLLILIAILASSYFYLPVKRQIAYRLGISGDITTSCCSEEEILKSDGAFDEGASVAFFNGKIIDYPKTSLARMKTPSNSSSSQVLGSKNSAGEEKWIEVSIPEQRLRAWEGKKIVMEFPISSGLWSPTPLGDYAIWYKTRYQKMEGGSKEMGTYYYLPNVPYNMFFFKGYAIHGAYWHNNFGQPMSHGCVNSPLANVSELFEWSGPVVPPDQNIARATVDNPGTRVFVH